MTNHSQEKTEKKNEKAFPSESAGRVMVTAVPVVHVAATIADVEALLLKEAKNFETINYIYVADKEGRLVGVLSVKEVFGFPKAALVSDIMRKELITVRPHTDQERAAMLAIKHNLKAIPVVDADNRFLGVVPSDVILNILHQESIEDVLRSAGIHKFKDPAKELIAASAAVHFRKRLPWLIVGLFGGLAAAVAIGFFERVLSEMLILAAFIPAVVYMADAVGTQTQTIFIRSLAIDHNLNLKKYLWREMIVGVSLAATLGLGISLLSFIWWEPAILGAILGFSFFAAIIAAAATAIMLSFILNKLEYDPAIASGPFATVISDITSIVIYFAIASFALNTVA